MRAERNQTTLAAPCTVSGRGYWSGATNCLTFLPAPADSGIRFVRTDLLGHPSVLAVVENRDSMPLRTCLSRGRAEVDMVEHVLAALHGLQIDNAIVHCTACEMPAMDGSSFAFTLALQAVGRVDLQEVRPTVTLDRTIRVGDDRQWIVAQPLPSPMPSSGLVADPRQRLELEYRLDFGPDSPILKSSHAIRLEPKTFFETICAARTFIGVETAQVLQARGMAKHVTEQDLIVFDRHGPVNNRLRYPDECARHKLLDLIGDLAVTGVDVVGRITSHRGGHQLNGQMSTALRELFAQQNPPNNIQPLRSPARAA
ncbi:MAG: UDP-3-O-acyl-N-acetylglucosamine deacetylase [Pirellulaceae bacterium]